MTVCIAAMSDHCKALSLVSDSKVSFGDMSADKAVLKNIPFVNEHALLIAGDDIGYAGQIMRKAKLKLAKGSPSSDEIAEVVFRECQEERNRIVEASVLLKRGFDWDRFRKEGKNLCPEASYFELQTEIAQVGLSIDFLIAGFDSKGDAHIRFTNWQTPPQDFDILGFYAIGSGSREAISSYSHAVEFLNLSRYSTTPEVTYHTMAAKFMAESARDVGRETFCVVIRKDRKAQFLSIYGGEDFVRSQWTKFGAPRQPENIGEKIESISYEGDALDPVQLQKASKYLPRAKKQLSGVKRSTVQKLGLKA